MAVLFAFVVTSVRADSDFRASIERDWLLQERYRTNQLRVGLAVPTTADASGGCDGLKSGAWGFHTGQTRDPWWQVDLDTSRSLSRIVIWNRCDSEVSAAKAAHLTVRLSDDARTWRVVYVHDGTPFGGEGDRKPLPVPLDHERARFVRIQLAGETALHLDEIEVFGPEQPERNLALGHRADQSSVSEWSFDHRPPPEPDWVRRTAETLAHCERLLRELRDAPTGNAEGSRSPADFDSFTSRIVALKTRLGSAPDAGSAKALYLEARWIQRGLTLANPLLDFDSILVTKRVPGTYSHMSDQYYGWWSRPGGGIYRLRNFRDEEPEAECLTTSFTATGSFLRPSLSYGATKILFAWCRHHPGLAGEQDKLNKANVPEDAFYHVFEMNIDGSGVRQLTFGKYDDFDARYLPDGRIVFLSTRRGQFVQVGRSSARQTLARPDLPDCYVRCGGDGYRPVAVYTLHTMNADGSDLTAISPFEMFEWEPAIAHDGSILHARWDYIDRDNMPFMSLWAINPDGTSPRLIYKNYTRKPHCVFEPQPIPGSRKILFTASGHHSHSMGSLVLLDPAAGTEGNDPITRLTPEVPFPEIEGWPITYYSAPWPLSERFHLVAWGDDGAATHAQRWHKGGGRWEGIARPENSLGIYFFDASGNMELLYRDPAITTTYPIPLRARPRPPVLPAAPQLAGSEEGRFLMQDVYQGMTNVARGEIKALRIVAVPPKTQPWMNRPEMGLTHDDPGKCVLGTVPVEGDGSAYFRAPAGVIVFFQALDDRGRALRTMRSATHVQPGQTASCIGCHSDRAATPAARPASAASRQPSRISVGPDGSWPFRFDRLVQPVLDRHCTACHRGDGSDALAAKFDLTSDKAYETLTRYGNPSLTDQVWRAYREGVSRAGEGLARQSALLKLLDGPERHHDLKLDEDSFERLVTWTDIYAQRSGSFSKEQEHELERLRRDWAEILIERHGDRLAASGP